MLCLPARRSISGAVSRDSPCTEQCYPAGIREQFPGQAPTAQVPKAAARECWSQWSPLSQLPGKWRAPEQDSLLPSPSLP